MIIDMLDEFALAHAAELADRPAVLEPGGEGALVSTTYRELARQVDRFADQLTKLGVAVGDRIVIESHTSAAAIALLLACARCGAAFVPLSPDTPQRRVESIVTAIEPVLYLHSEESAPRELPVGSARFDRGGIVVEFARAQWSPPTRERAVGSDAAYIIFTSGTTGTPKGVVLSHQSALAFYRGAQRFGVVQAGDRVATTSPLQFDVALFDICVTLGSGATVVAVSRECLSFPRRLVSYLHQAEVTIVHAVPSLWRPLLRHEPDGVAALRHLRGILFAGEDFPLAELRRLRELQPELRIVNAFGATETVAAALAEVPNPLPAQTERLSIGRGYPGAELFLIEDGKPVTEPDAVGELYVRCPSMFSGYWNDPEATRRVLVPDPLEPRTGQLVYRSGDLAYRGCDGELYFCGRADSMVKIRGNRVELGEVERCLLAHPAVAAAVAIVAGQAQTLAAFVVPTAEVSGFDLVAWCKQTLPAYMIPKQIDVLDELPLTVNGKVDRQVLAGKVG